MTDVPTTSTTARKKRSRSARLGPTHTPARDERESTYERFLAKKGAVAVAESVTHGPLAPSLFPHQSDLVTWALRRGRAAIFASTGLGKSRMEIEWARHVVAYTGQPVLMLAPLAVARQMVDEGAEVGVDVKLCRELSDGSAGVNVTNYDRLRRFDGAAFGGVVLDESSIIKHHDAKTFAALTEAFRATRFKLCGTATPAPNDFTELGTHAEFLGICTRVEMLSEWFVHDGGETQKWRLKGHARAGFWRWVASWGAVVRHPRDLGYETVGYDLPPLEIEQHILPADERSVRAVGTLIPMEARTLSERRAARRGSVEARVAACADVVNANDEQWIIWCDLNAESEALTRAIRGAVEVRGSDDPDAKEERLASFARGEIRVMVTKPKIAGFGLNLQRISNVAFVGVTDSFESYYQAIRRCWRFGQTRRVRVVVYASELEGAVVANLQRKERDAAALADAVAESTRETVLAEVRGVTRLHNDYDARSPMRLPVGLISEVK